MVTDLPLLHLPALLREDAEREKGQARVAGQGQADRRAAGRKSSQDPDRLYRARSELHGQDGGGGRAGDVAPVEQDRRGER